MSTLSLSLQTPQKRYCQSSGHETLKRQKQTDTVKGWDDMRGCALMDESSFATSVVNAVYTLEPVRRLVESHRHAAKPLYETLTSFVETYDAEKIQKLLEIVSGFDDGRAYFSHAFFLHLLSSLDREADCYKATPSLEVSNKHVREKCQKLHELFGNLIESEFRCTACGSRFTSSVYTRTLELPCDAASMSCSGKSIDQCLKHMLRCVDYSLYCMKCGREQQHCKQAQFRAIGEVLVVSMRRASQSDCVLSDTLELSCNGALSHYRAQAVVSRFGPMDSCAVVVRHPILEQWKYMDAFTSCVIRLADVPPHSAELVFYTRSRVSRVA